MPFGGSLESIDETLGTERPADAPVASEGFGFLTGALVLRQIEAPVSEALRPQMAGPSLPTVDFKSIAMVRLTQ